MKKLIFSLIVGFAFFSCSDDNCAEKKADIMKQYELEKEFYKDDPRALEQLEITKDAKLANAC